MCEMTVICIEYCLPSNSNTSEATCISINRAWLVRAGTFMTVVLSLLAPCRSHRCGTLRRPQILCHLLPEQVLCHATICVKKCIYWYVWLISGIKWQVSQFVGSREGNGMAGEEREKKFYLIPWDNFHILKHVHAPVQWQIHSSCCLPRKLQIL